ncbi:MAG: FkbM family methyltransferase [Candidatus Aceula meridiana]|nr:FkbM family methyltransferase [Candidatus Aceula meridiana]
MNIKKIIKQIINKSGYDIVQFHPDSSLLDRRRKLMVSERINVVLDVGANSGQFAQELRSVGCRERIVSFEPLSSAYAKLASNSRLDVSWEVFNLALGDKDGKAIINIAENSQSSSILKMLPAHLKSDPNSGHVGQEEIEIAKLDSVFGLLHLEGKSIYLKIDTQGFEESVLRGAENSLQFIDTIQLEMSLTPLYCGELLFPEMHALLCGKGYQMISIELGFADPCTGRVLQVDGIFHRRN